MTNFNDTESLDTIDPRNARRSTELIVKQCKTAWEESQKIEVTHGFGDIKQIVFCGMGASIYGALVLKSLLTRELPYPTEMVTDYHLPEYVGPHTLVVLTSYSGTTEEVLSCAEDARARQAKMLVLTKGGPLADFAKNHKLTSYIFDGALNPAGSPRLGAGYTILGLLGLFNKVGIIAIEEQEVTNALQRLEENFEEIKIRARQDYEQFVNKIPIIFSAEHLAGNAQILRNQFNETSKTFSALYLIPDLNHHLMEGLQFPKNAPLTFISIDSPNYSPKITKRVNLTTDVVKKNNREVFEYKTNGTTLYDDFLEVLVYGSFITLYLALYYGQNPATNPWVDYFKEELAKS